METNSIDKIQRNVSKLNNNDELPVVQDNEVCGFTGYDVDSLMKETVKLRKIITKRGTLEILIPLCCTTKPVDI